MSSEGIGVTGWSDCDLTQVVALSLILPPELIPRLHVSVHGKSYSTPHQPSLGFHPFISYWQTGQKR